MTTPTLTEPPLLTVKQVADLLQITVGATRGFIHAGVIEAVKLDPTASNSEWRIPRAALDRWLGPWRPPVVHAPPDSHLAPPDRTNPTEGGLSREALRERAGFAPERGPGVYPVPEGAITDTPTGSVTPTHPDRAQPREPVLNLGRTTPLQRPLPAPLAPGQADPRRPEAEHTVESTVTLTPPPEPAVYEGAEPDHPIDPSTFGAGPRA